MHNKKPAIAGFSWDAAQNFLLLDPHLLPGKCWISLFPGLALLATIVAINLVGDRLRDLLNP